MATEIERKFLVDAPPDWLSDHPADQIEQGYLAIVEGVREVRLRRKGEDSLLTVKLGSGESRREEEIELSQEQFDSLWPLTEGLRVSKTRYRVPHDAGVIETDVYSGELAGMITAEIEFDSADDSRAFEPPKWLDREVTGDSAYANESLALRGAPKGGES